MNTLAQNCPELCIACQMCLYEVTGCQRLRSWQFRKGTQTFAKMIVQLVVVAALLTQAFAATPAERAAEMLAKMNTTEKLAMMYVLVALNIVALNMR